MATLTREKLDQAVRLVQASDSDVWLTLVRETSLGSDPVLPLVLHGGLTWTSALMVTRDGRTVAVVGNYDADPLRESGDWDEVVPYVQGMREQLLKVLEASVRPGGRIAVNYSKDDPTCDGLSHGLLLLLQEYLAGTRFEGSLISAQSIVGALRGQKTPDEVRRMRAAIAETERVFSEIGKIARIGTTEREVYDAIHDIAGDRGLGFSWDPAGDPIVNSGPDSMIGHGIPSADITIQPGHIFHIDLGFLKEGYASDLQRSWFVGNQVPNDVAEAFAAVHGAISAGAAILRPGVRGCDVDAAARSFLIDRGYPEYLHAFGHQVGRVAHDGGALLGPEWERYGDTPRVLVKEREVYTLELGITLPNRGYLGIEEMVLVTSTGVEWLSNRQNEIWLLE